MKILIIVLTSIVGYYLSLVYITRIKFLASKIKLSIPLSLFIPLHILYIHIIIAYQSRLDRKKVKRILTTYVLAYDLPLVVLIEYLNFKLETADDYKVSKNRIKKKNFTTKLFEFLKSRASREGYSESLLEYCV